MIFISNGRADVLHTGIDSTNDKCTLNDGSTFPSDGPFVIKIGSEIILVASVRNPGEFEQLTRGYNGSTPADHAVSTAVAQVVPGGLDLGEPYTPTATSPGTTGMLAHDASYLYLCVAANTWLRSPLFVTY